jgi:hypothetical protein
MEAYFSLSVCSVTSRASRWRAAAGAEFLARGDDLRAKKSMLEQVAGAAHQALRLLKGLLDFTQARVGGELTFE